MTTQVFAMSSRRLLAVLTLAGQASLPGVYALAVLGGVGWCSTRPARHR